MNHPYPLSKPPWDPFKVRGCAVCAPQRKCEFIIFTLLWYTLSLPVASLAVLFTLDLNLQSLPAQCSCVDITGKILMVVTPGVPACLPKIHFWWVLWESHQPMYFYVCVQEGWALDCDFFKAVSHHCFQTSCPPTGLAITILTAFFIFPNFWFYFDFSSQMPHNTSFNYLFKECLSQWHR